jgi:predicted kinase
VLRTDVLRKQHFHIKETDRLPEGAYQPEVTEKIYEILVERAARILVQGHSAVVDAVAAGEAERAEISGVARRLNHPFFGFFLVTDLATRRQRIGQRKADASDVTPEIAEVQEKYDIGAMDWAVVDASGAIEETLEQCRIPSAGF